MRLEKRFILILIVSLLSVFFASSLEVSLKEIQIEGFNGKAYLLSGHEDLPGGGPLLAFGRAQAEEIAACFEEKELLEADFETLNLYSTELEVYNSQLEESKSRLQRWNTGLVAGLLGIATGILTYALLK